jgi:hypothetical protein
VPFHGVVTPEDPYPIIEINRRQVRLRRYSCFTTTAFGPGTYRLNVRSSGLVKRELSVPTRCFSIPTPIRGSLNGAALDANGQKIDCSHSEMICPRC